MNFLTHLWEKSNVLLFDGAMGTQLIQKGLESGKVPDVWNIENPAIIQDIYGHYYNAGSDLVQTCTFGSNLLNLESYNLQDKLFEINWKALENINAVKPENKFIVGDIGPSGKYRPPVGNVTENQWYESFLAQVLVLEPGIDVWHIETMSDITEMLTAIHAIKEISIKPIMASMTYRFTKKGYFTIMGDSLETCVGTLEDERVDVIGTNCTLNSSLMVDLAQKLCEMTNKPVLVKPNAGQPRLEGGTTLYDQKPEDFVKDIEKMIGFGVKIVGGCCGTTPTHIRLLRALIDTIEEEKK